MQILLTNDDGIFADGIYALYKELVKVAKVDVVAPDSERSSVGHAITLSHPIVYKKVKRHRKFFGYAVRGTPADCVKFALGVLLKKKPDVVISGINLGANDGCSVFYSGTVAGAREGALLGIPAIAVSLAEFFNPNFSYAAKCTVKLVKALLKTKIPSGTFFNVNVPNLPASRIRGIIMTRQGIEPIHSSFHKRTDPNLREYYWMSGKSPVKPSNTNFDTYALNNRYVTVTPVSSDSTDYNYLNTTKKLHIN